MRAKIINGLCGGAGVLITMTISTTLENRQAIAVLDSKVVEAKQISGKLDTLSDDVKAVSARIAMVRADISNIQQDVGELRAESRQADAEAKCDVIYSSQRDRDECYSRRQTD